MKFLSGLTDDFDVVKTQILMMEPFPNVDKVFSLVIQQEHRICPLHTEEVQSFANAADTRKPYGRGKSSFKICTHCGKSGHTMETCYKHFGYPGTSKGKEMSSSNNVIGESSSNPVDEDIKSTKSDTDQAILFTPEQCKAIMAFVQ